MKISKIEIYNMVKEKYLLPIEISSDSITFLTGYNGTCKTSILQAIHKSLSDLAGLKYPIVRKNWGVRIELDQKEELLTICLKQNKEGIDGSVLFEKNMNKIIPTNIKTFYDSYENVHKNVNQEYINIDEKTYIKNSEMRTETDECLSVITGGLMKYYHSNDDQIAVKSILFCDEVISFSFKNDFQDEKALEKLDVFSKKNNIDKTLFYLIELYKKNDDYDPYINERLRFKLKKYLKEESLRELDLEMLESTNSTSNNTNINLIEVINSFYKLINKKMKFDSRNSFHYYKNDKIIKWFDFSKGEKFLLVLILLAFNFRNENSLFLFDEPDSYLHIEWQNMLLTKLKQIAPECSFIIASHSPSLISKETKINFINLNKYIV